MRKKRFNRLIGTMIDERTYQLLVQKTDEQQISISKFVRKMLEDRFHSQERIDQFNASIKSQQGGNADDN